MIIVMYNIIKLKYFLQVFPDILKKYYIIFVPFYSQVSDPSGFHERPYGNPPEFRWDLKHIGLILKSIKLQHSIQQGYVIIVPPNCPIWSWKQQTIAYNKHTNLLYIKLFCLNILCTKIGELQFCQIFAIQGNATVATTLEIWISVQFWNVSLNI